MAELPVHCPEPGFSRSNSYRSRPHHSSVPIDTSTTPILSPPPTPPPEPAPPVLAQYSSPYGGYGSSAYDDDKDPLLPRRRSSVGDVFGGGGGLAGTGSSLSVGKLLTYTAVAAGCIFIISRLAGSSRAGLSSHLSPFLPAALISLLGSTGISPSSPHPILPHLAKADTKWKALLATQSTTFDRATRTYKSRYSLPPPPGFDKWFAFASQGRNHTLVDEYDQLMRDLLPFRSLSPPEIRRRTAELAQIPGISIVSIRSGVAQVHSKSGKWAPALAFQQMLSAFVRDLPDMDIAINEKPEGRVLPRRQRSISKADYGLVGDELTQNMSDPMVRPTLKGFQAEWQRDGTVWDTVRRSCPIDSPARRLVESVRSAETGAGAQVQARSGSKGLSLTSRRKTTGITYPSTREMTFNAETESSFDVCARPSLHSLYSAFFSDQRSIEYLYPVFSASKPEGYADILIPSHHYWSPSSEYTYEWELKRGRTKEPTDVDWDLKTPTIFWRGKVVRGADTPPGRAGSFQKQRLVKMANEASTHMSRTLVTFDPTTASLAAASAPLPIANKAMSDIAMACDPNLGECSYLRSLGYRVEQPGPLSDAWKHKYVLDVDEIGFSPRFLALMESKSAVIKTTIQKEFWSEWVVPWKHFIPLSSAYSELYNIAAFFSGIPESLRAAENFTTTVLTTPSPLPTLPLTADSQPFKTDRALRDIAEAGSAWRQTHARKGDMECYVYRLMIEWAAMVAEE